MASASKNHTPVCMTVEDLDSKSLPELKIGKRPGMKWFKDHIIVTFRDGGKNLAQVFPPYAYSVSSFDGTTRRFTFNITGEEAKYLERLENDYAEILGYPTDKLQSMVSRPAPDSPYPATVSAKINVDTQRLAEVTDWVEQRYDELRIKIKGVYKFKKWGIIREFEHVSLASPSLADTA